MAFYFHIFLLYLSSHYVLIIHRPHSLLNHTVESSFPYVSPLILERAQCSTRDINCWDFDEEAVNRNSAIVDHPMDSKLATMTAKPTLGASQHNAVELFVSYRSRNQYWVTGVSSQPHSRGLREDKCYFSSRQWSQIPSDGLNIKIKTHKSITLPVTLNWC